MRDASTYYQCQRIQGIFFPHFSNSLKIYQIETKEVMTDGVRISDLNYHRFFRLYFSVFSSGLVSVLETVFDQISKHFKIRQKDSASHRKRNGQCLACVHSIRDARG